MSHASTVRKLKILRAELTAYQAYAGASRDLDAAVHGVLDATGSSWVGVQRYLSPELLLRLDRRSGSPIYALVTEVDPPVVVTMTTESIDEWTESLGSPNPKLEVQASKGELGAAIRAIQTIHSRALSGRDLSGAKRAMAVILKALNGV